VPPLPTGDASVTASEGGLDDALATSSAVRPSGTPASGNGWAPERAAGWTADRPGVAAPTDGRGTSAGGVSRFVSRDPSAAVPRQATAAATDGSLLNYRGKPLQLSKSRRFTWEYDMQHGTGDGRPLRAELWCTRDSGVTWQRAGVDTDGKSPIDVSLPAAGLYGFRLLIVPDGSNNETGPRTGESPETWVAIDDDPPQVEPAEVEPSSGDAGDGVLIRYACRDQLPSPRGVRLSFSPRADGPWSTIADGLEPEGTHRWQPDRTTPGSVYIRIEATDAAGNVGRSITPEPVVISAAQVVGRLRGLRELPAGAATLAVPDGAP